MPVRFLAPSGFKPGACLVSGCLLGMVGMSAVADRADRPPVSAAAQDHDAQAPDALAPDALAPDARNPTAEDPAAENRFIDLFDGHTLNGWEGDAAYWRVQDGVLIGEITPETVIKNNYFLIYQGHVPDDFELLVVFRVSALGNSGIQYRSQVIDGLGYHAMRGYQYDIDGRHRFTGSNYEERNRTTLAGVGESVRLPPIDGAETLQYKQKNRWTAGIVQRHIAPGPALRARINDHDWNTARIVADGHRLRHFINDQLISEVIDDDQANRRLSGKLGVQVHVGPPMTIEYRQIRIRALPAKTTPPNPAGDAPTPESLPGN